MESLPACDIKTWHLRYRQNESKRFFTQENSVSNDVGSVTEALRHQHTTTAELVRRLLRTQLEGCTSSQRK
jgi:hypothetical protein